MDKQTKGEQRREFASLVRSGVSTAKAAEAVGISSSTGFKWAQALGAQRKRKGKAKFSFARLVPQSSTTSQIHLEVAGVVIKVDSRFDDDALARLIRVARGAQ